ncbi:MAG: hypothetical protein V1664_04575 [Candidatus Uhrbacteria bacterium]
MEERRETLLDVPGWLSQIIELAKRFTTTGFHGLMVNHTATDPLGRALYYKEITPQQVLDLIAGRLVLREAAAVPPAASAAMPAPITPSAPAEIRLAQARRLFELGFGGEGVIFETYLEGIPEIPAFLVANDSKLPLLFLADPRPGLVKACQLIGIKYAEFGYGDESAEPCDKRHSDPTEPFWFRCNDGRSNRNRKPTDCRIECTGNLLAGTAMVGVTAYAHKVDIVKEGEHIIDLPGSVDRDARGDCAYLGVWRGQPKLFLDRDAEIAYPHYGSLVFRRE